MTKRYFVSGYAVWDSYNNDRRVDTRSKPICDLLNQLNDENEQLRKEKIDAEVKLYSANEKILMQMDYDEIIKQNTENEIEITTLKKENEQLKIALKDKENLISICEKKFKELGYLITCDDDGYVIE